MARKLYVGNISYRATEEDIKKKFDEVGRCVSVTIVVDKFSGQSKGFGFVEMATEDEAQEAIKRLNRTAMYGRGIIVTAAQPPRPRRERG